MVLLKKYLYVYVNILKNKIYYYFIFLFRILFCIINCKYNLHDDFRISKNFSMFYKKKKKNFSMLLCCVACGECWERGAWRVRCRQIRWWDGASHFARNTPRFSPLKLWAPPPIFTVPPTAPQYFNIQI